VTMAEAGRGSGPEGLAARRVVLLAESAGLAAVLGHLLGPADRLSRLGSLRALGAGRLVEDADVVVLDLPDEDRAAAVGQVRRCYAGPLVVLAGEGEAPGRSGLDDACILVPRPFSVEDLAAALSVPGRTSAAAAAAALAPTAGTGPTAAGPRPAAAPTTAPGRPELAARAQGLLVSLVEGWQARREVRVAGFAALAVLAFTVAFVLAAQGRCGPGCDQLDTGVAPLPTMTSVGLRAAAPTTRPRHPTSTTTIRAGTPETGAFLGASERPRATATGERRAATTTGESTTSRRPATTQPGTSQPATSRPATTQSTVPPSTGPTTTQPATTPPTTATG
jgi:hypothetical protein